MKYYLKKYPKHKYSTATILSFLLIVLITFVALKPVSAAQTSAEMAQQVQQMVNVNQADVEQLVILKGIGKKKAAAIVAYRKQHGRFKSVDELTKVKGVSQGIVDRNKAMLKL